MQKMIDTRTEQGLSGSQGLQCLCPQMCCPKSTAPHFQCPAATVLSCGCFLEASHGLGLVRCCLRYCLCRNREGGTDYALKCGNAAVFRNKFLCFGGCGREHLWSEQCCSSSRRLHSGSWLPPAAPGISTGCSLGPGI